MATVTESWDTLMNWLAEHLPAALGSLAPPASEAAINEAEAVLGRSMPADWQALYRRHNGEILEVPPGVFDDGHRFLPLQQLAELAQMARTHAIPADELSLSAWKQGIEAGLISVHGPVKPLAGSPDWIPFTSMNGDITRYLDFDPAPGGTPGQIIETDPEAGVYCVLAPSLEEFLANYVAGLQSGRFRVEDQAIIDTRLEDSQHWAMPAYLAGVELPVVDPADNPAPGEAPTNGVPRALVGRVAGLIGTGHDTRVQFILADGREYTIHATAAATRGFSAIAVDQYARITAVRGSEARVGADFAHLVSEPPELLAERFERIAEPPTPERSTKKRPWWRFW